jgi:hypothetical protein
MAKSSDVILVHGAWADGSSWAKVIPLLTARGHSVTAVQLPLTSLGDDVATVKRAIALASGPIIMARQDVSLPCRIKRPRHPACPAAEHGQAPERGGC